MEGGTSNEHSGQGAKEFSSNGILKSAQGDPINELQKLVQKQKRQWPVYTFSYFLDKGLFHTFKCVVTVDGQSMYAEAKSKKEAKVAAVEKLLKSLRDAELNSMDTTDTPSNRVYRGEDLSKNPIAKLQEYLQQQKRQLPVYAFTNCQHIRDNPIFRCVLTVDGQSMYAEAKSKKEAKNAVASKFLHLLCNPEVNSKDTAHPYTSPLRVNNSEGGPSTNPITKLQELMQQQGHPLPVYAFVNCHIDGDPPIFRCIVTADSKTACAMGKRKKEAKYAAAETLLQSLQADTTDSTVNAPTPDVRVNYFGNLQIFCQQSHKQPPKYQVLQSDTIPAIFKVTLSVGDVVSVAEATRKKDAMQLAAKKLLDKLLVTESV